jgi:hypothetical protein
MKRFAFLLSCSAALACAADLSSVHNVYLLKMSKGLDQYLANQLTNGHVFQVVTDPKLADTIFTDQIGEGFKAKLEELYPPAEGEKAPAPKPKAEDEASPILGDTVNKLENPAANSSFGRSRGTFFLVDAKSHSVVWSTFEPAKNATSQSLDRTAKDIVSRIQHDLKQLQKGK